MHHRFDQLGKKIGLKALTPSGLTVAHDEISPDAHHADLRHEPDPARAAERARLGLLGRMASIVCLIEIYSGAPDEDETLACLGKLIAFRQKRRRDARKNRRKRPSGAETFVRPFVWIVSAGRPTTVLAALSARKARDWPQGVYFSPGVLLDAAGARLDGLDGLGGLLRVGIVVASELPRDRSTLLIRLMAGGPMLKGALEDLAALPADAHEHAVARAILLGLQHAFGHDPHPTAEERQLMEDLKLIGQRLIQKSEDKGHKKGHKEGHKEGLDEGRLVQARAAVRRVLAVRNLAPSAVDEARIDDCTDLAMLERWHAQAIIAHTVAEALRSPARRAAPRARARVSR